MFYCNNCKIKNGWSYSFNESYGKCEVCGIVGVCNDVPSSRLPMPHQTAETSINCYHDHVKGFKENSENKKIYEALKRIQPASCRMLSKDTGIENSDCARSLNNLWYGLKPPPIQKSHKGKCPVSGITVQFYHIQNGQISLQL